MRVDLLYLPCSPQGVHVSQTSIIGLIHMLFAMFRHTYGTAVMIGDDEIDLETYEDDPEDCTARAALGLGVSP